MGKRIIMRIGQFLNTREKEIQKEKGHKKQKNQKSLHFLKTLLDVKNPLILGGCQTAI